MTLLHIKSELRHHEICKNNKYREIFTKIFISSQDGNSFPYQILSTSVYKYNKIRTRDRLIENYLPKKKNNFRKPRLRFVHFV